tara:strand:- start:7064 stop:7246 length:183 start_codon:yes stop_codon:yes gene_type:complete
MYNPLREAWLKGATKSELDTLHNNQPTPEEWNDAHAVAHKLKQVGMFKESTRYLKIKGYL